MSLYGTGRAEGVSAVLLIGLLVVGAHMAGAWCSGEAELLAAAFGAVLPATGGMLCYRFLRAQGRSRYAAFLAGAAYGSSPWLAVMAAAPREQLAAVLAPLALEAACHCGRPQHRRTWLPWAALAIAAPFVAGVTVIATLISILCAASCVRTLAAGDQEGGAPAARSVLVVAALSALAAFNLAWLDPLAALLGERHVVPTLDVLAAHRPTHPGFDVAAVLRVPGPVLLSFAALGMLRRQRHVDALAWLGVAVAGALPTLFTLVPELAGTVPPWTTIAMVPATAWWLTLLAIAVLAAAGLDDFLDLPLRRHAAVAWLLALAVVFAPLVPAFGARHPEREWPLTATFLALALMLPAWRRLGILRFKNWLATVVLLTLAFPMLQGIRITAPPPATPMVETAPLVPQPPPALPPRAHEALLARPVWHYAGLLVALATGVCWSLFAWRRRTTDKTTPKAAKAAITKKAKRPKKK